MNIYDNLKALTAGLISVIIDTGAYKKDDHFMENCDMEDIRGSLHKYLNLEKYCMYIKRTRLFYRTEEEVNDVFSDAFIEAFFRSKGYPIKSFKGFTINKGSTRSVRLSKFLKDSLLSKIITINVAIHEKKSSEVHEHRLSNSDGEAFEFDTFLSANGVESLDIDLNNSIDLDECDAMLMELSDKIYPQVSYVMLLKDYEISQEEFQGAMRYQLNVTEVPEILIEKYEKIAEVIGNVIMHNKGKLGDLFGVNRLETIGAV